MKWLQAQPISTTTLCGVAHPLVNRNGATCAQCDELARRAIQYTTYLSMR
jgi:hypothetical protein